MKSFRDFVRQEVPPPSPVSMRSLAQKYQLAPPVSLKRLLLGSSWPSVVSSWAILLVRFKDDSTPEPSLTSYNDLFTSVGNAKRNMVHFFNDMSHQKLNLSSSQVFGWYTLDQNRADYSGNQAHVDGKINRNELIEVSKSKAIKASVQLSKFAGVVVSVLGATDLFGILNGMAMVCDSTNLRPSLLGQEMGHGYGLDHARKDGSETDYQDQWDVMSTDNAYEAPDPDFTNVGPGLNAWNMRSRGWLIDSLVWRNSRSTFDEVITLRPLHRLDLPGFLCAELGEFLVEFRLKEGWDAAIPQSCILVHRFADNHSYLMGSSAGRFNLVGGDTFVSSDNTLEVDVVSIDAVNRSASIRLIKTQ